MRTACIFLIALASFGHVSSQNTIGIPDIVNHFRNVYGAGTQNRGITQDRNGILYFANYQGLLSFDGVYWKLYPLANKSVVRSVAIGPDNKIYVGGQNDLGYFAPDKDGNLRYTSLKSFLPLKDVSFTDIWNVYSFNNSVFFRSREKIFQLSNKAFTVYPATEDWRFLGISNNRLIAQEGKNRLLEFKDGMWVPFVKTSELPEDFLVTSTFPIGRDSTFITTVNTGFYILKNNKITSFKFRGVNPFQSQRVLTAIAVTPDRIAIGTNLIGCIIVNTSGEIIQTLSRKEGLQINNILSLFVDSNQNLWLGMDNGIDFIAYNNAVKHIYPEKMNEGEGYTSYVYNNRLYVGTSNGLYTIPLTDQGDLSMVNGEFRFVEGTRGSTISLNEINGQLLLAHHDGAFQVNNEQIIPITRETSFWTFLPFYNVLPSSLVLAGCDLGLRLVEYRNGRFLQKQTVPGFAESSQFIAINNNILWIAHPYKGVFKVDLSNLDAPRATFYSEKDGLPSSVKNQLYKIKNQILIATEKGLYEYNPKNDRFEPSAFFRPFFAHRNIRLLKEDGAGNVWFVEDKDLGVIDLSGHRPEKIYFPELSGKMVSGMEHVYPYDKNNVFVGAEKGFYHINYEQYRKKPYDFQVKIRTVKAFGKTDSVLFGGYYADVNEIADQPGEAVRSMSSNWSSLHFEYSAPLYEHNNSIVYSYLLEGYDKKWSPWSNKTEKEYTSLPAGSYVFKVKAKNHLGKESSANQYAFRILPPWYQAVWAYLLYLLIGTLIVFTFYRRHQRVLLLQKLKYEKEQRQLQYFHQLELEKSEKEIIKLKNEKLEAEIAYKNSELASTTMHLVQKGDLLANIKEQMTRMRKSGSDEGSQNDVRKIIRILSEENTTDKDWDQFALYFDKVHSDFLKTMKTAYPNLTPHELKLSAYLLLNLSSKEIAQLENISVRGVEIGRYRLRKKLMLTKETNLFDFLVRFSPVQAKAVENGNDSSN